MRNRVLAFALLACAACQTDQERALAHLATARASAESGAHADAVGALEQAVELDPTLRDAWGLLGRERAALGQHEGAVAAIRHVTDHDPRDREAWRLLAREQLALGAHQEAIAAAEHVIAMDAPSADDAELLARARMGLEDWAGAREAFARALELDATRHPLLLEIGRSEEHLGREVDALATYRRAIEADASSVEARIRVTRLLIQRARGEQLRGEDPQLSREQALADASAFGMIGLLGGNTPYVDRHLETRTEARALLAAAREHLDGEADPRRQAIDAYGRELDELDAASERARVETEERNREAARSLRSVFGAGGLGDGFLLGALGGDAIGDSFGAGGLGLGGVGGGGGGEGTIGLGNIGTIGHGAGTGTGQGYGRGAGGLGRLSGTAREEPLVEPAAAP